MFILTSKSKTLDKRLSGSFVGEHVFCPTPSDENRTPPGLRGGPSLPACGFAKDISVTNYRTVTLAEALWHGRHDFALPAAACDSYMTIMTAFSICYEGLTFNYCALQHSFRCCLIAIRSRITAGAAAVCPCPRSAIGSRRQLWPGPAQAPGPGPPNRNAIICGKLRIFFTMRLISAAIVFISPCMDGEVAEWSKALPC